VLPGPPPLSPAAAAALPGRLGVWDPTAWVRMLKPEATPRHPTGPWFAASSAVLWQGYEALHSLHQLPVRPVAPAAGCTAVSDLACHHRPWKHGLLSRSGSEAGSRVLWGCAARDGIHVWCVSSTSALRGARASQMSRVNNIHTPARAAQWDGAALADPLHLQGLWPCVASCPAW
jgi:hypothetical protein